MEAWEQVSIDGSQTTSNKLILLKFKFSLLHVGILHQHNPLLLSKVRDCQETTNFLNYRLTKEEKSPCILVRYTIEVLLCDGQLCPVVSSAGLTSFYGILCLPEGGKFFLQGPMP